MSGSLFARRGLFVAAGAAVLLPGVARAAADVGRPAPDFSGVDSNGTTHTLEGYRGRPVVLEWTNHQCPYVMKHYSSGNMQAQQREARAKGVVWLSIVSSAPGEQGHVEGARANELTASRKADPSAVLLDPMGRIGRAYGATVTPHMYLIDARGTLVYKGGIDSLRSADAADIPRATQYVRQAIDHLLTNRPIPEPSTRAYGCTVKYSRTST